MTSVALIEDDDAYREGLARALAASGRFEVRHNLRSAEEAMRLLPLAPPELALVDISLPGKPGPAAVLRLRESCPQLRCMMLTMFDDADHIFGALQAGAAGYLLKSATADEIIAALDELAAGGAPMSRAIARRVLASFARPLPDALAAESLTAREREIMEQLVRGISDKEIASALGISTSTVKNHLYRIYEKLAVRSRTEAVVKWSNA
jgi:DNA-binding NarL/FixJ family response regulator